MRMILRRFLIAMVLVPTCALAQSYDKGVEYLNAGAWEAALEELEPLAQRGHASAQNLVGDLYYVMLGSSDIYKAAKWHGLAARQGIAQSQYALGSFHFSGQGVLQDFVLAHI